MDQRSRGPYRVLESPRIYESVQRLAGGRNGRRRFISEFVRPFAGARVLDVGCGPAMLLERLPAGVEYTGFDVNPACIEAARDRYGDRGRFFCARVGEETGAIGEGEYDFVLASGVLHHLSDADASHLLGAARRYLKPGGAFVSIDLVWCERQPWLSRVLTSLDRGGHVRTEEGYRRLAESHFSEMETWTVSDHLRLPYRHFIIRAIGTPRAPGAS